jgi:energy-coupling factor transporter transmembrane protein EcfT
MGMSIISSGKVFPGIVIIICSAMIIPYFNSIIEKKIKIRISGGVKFLLIIIIIVALGFGMTGTNNSNSLKNTNNIDDQNIDNKSLEPTTTSDKDTVQIYSFGDKVDVGNFAYTVNSYEIVDKIGHDLMGQFVGEKADGHFLIFDVIFSIQVFLMPIFVTCYF